MPTPKLTNEIIKAAILGFEEQKRQLDGQIAELQAMLTGGPVEMPAPSADQPQRRKMSAAGRRAIAEAQRKRWAQTKAASGDAPAEKPKRRLSAAGRRAIIAAAKRRWAAQKAAQTAAQS